MAKKLIKKDEFKKALAANQIQDLLGSILTKEVGGVVSTSNQEFVSTGLRTLDHILGGGYPVGQYTHIVGHPGAAKSTLVCCACKNLERTYPEGFTVYIDTEQSMSMKRLNQLGVTRVTLINGVSIEQVYAYVPTIGQFKASAGISNIPSLYIWDTLANTVSEKELTKADNPNSVTGWRARLHTFWIPKLLPSLAMYKLAFIVINQFRQKVMDNMMMAPATNLKYLTYGKEIPGGEALKFNSYTLIELKDKGQLPDTFGFPGAQIEVKVVKCKAFPANSKLLLALDYRSGFSDFWSGVLFLRQHKKLGGTASSQYLVNYPDRRTLLRNFEKIYNEDPKFKQAFDELLAETLEEVYAYASSYIITPPSVFKQQGSSEEDNDNTSQANQTDTASNTDEGEPPFMTGNDLSANDILNTSSEIIENATNLNNTKEENEALQE